jgi:hypothetical protein
MIASLRAGEIVTPKAVSRYTKPRHVDASFSLASRYSFITISYVAVQQSGFLGGRESILTSSDLAILAVSGLGSGGTAFRSALKRLHGLESTTGKSLAHRGLRTSLKRENCDLHRSP